MEGCCTLTKGERQLGRQPEGGPNTTLPVIYLCQLGESTTH